MSDIAHGGALRLASSLGNGQAAVAQPRPFAGRVFALMAVNGAMFRVVATLLSINLVSRLLSGVSILISVWLFAPADFARFGALLAALTLASAVQFLRYESTIVSAQGQAGLRSAIRLTALVGLAVWSAMAMGAWLAVRLDVVGSDLAMLFLLALAGRAACRLVGRIVVRNGHFTLLGRATFALSAVQPVVVVLAFMLGSNGVYAMAMTDIVGNLAAGAYLVWRRRKSLLDACHLRPGDASVVSLALEWRALPLVNLPSTALAAAFTSVPLLVVLNLADVTVAGHVALAFRLLDVPAQILAAAISPIAMNRFNRVGDSPRRGRDPALVIWLMLAVAAVFGAISIAAVGLEPWLFGTAWRGVSEFLPLVALFQGGVALALPLIEVAGLRRNQRDLFVVQAFAMACVGIVALVVADWHVALLCFGLLAALRATCLAVPLMFWHEPRTVV